MKRLELFAKEDIKSYGFIYEADDSKCKTGSAKVMHSTFYVKDGIVEYGGPGAGLMMNKATQDLVAICIWHKYIHSVFVDVFTQEDQNPLNGWNKNYHGHMRVGYRGHTPYTEAEMEERRKCYERTQRTD